MHGLQVPAELAGHRLDAALHRLQPQLSRAVARRLCEIGAVAVDGVVGAAGQRLRPGELVEFAATTVELTLQLGLPVLHADGELLLLDKPAGLAVHAGPLVDDSVAARLAALPGAGLAHRLDRGSSGLLLAGRDAAVLRRLADAFAADAVQRDYLAVASGRADWTQRTVELPLRSTDQPRGDQPKVVVDRERGQPAVTTFTLLDRRADCTLLAARLQTGRTHQIRAHLLAIGQPLLGDPRYGDAAANAAALATHGVRRPLLHSHRLALAAADGGALQLQAPVPADFARLFASLRRPLKGA